MNWLQERDKKTGAIEPMHRISECRNFRISKAHVADRTVYHLWRVGQVPALCVGTRAECERVAGEGA